MTVFNVSYHILFLSAYSCWFFYFHTPVTFPHCRTSSLPTLLVCLEMFVLFLLKFVCEYSVVFLGFDSIFFLVLSHFLFYFLIVGPPPCQHPIFSVFCYIVSIILPLANIWQNFVSSGFFPHIFQPYNWHVLLDSYHNCLSQFNFEKYSIALIS